MAEVAIRTPTISICQWLGAERFKGLIPVGVSVERGAILGRLSGFSSDFKYIDVPLLSPATGVVTYIQSSEIHNEGELLVRVRCDEPILGDQYKIGADVFQNLHQKYLERLREGQEKIREKRESMIGGTIAGTLTLGGIGWALVAEGGAKIFGGLLSWVMVIVLFSILKKELAEARQQVSQYPRESALTSAWTSAISVHLA